MALNAYLSLTGSKTGEIKGSVIQKGRDGKIMVIAADHEIVSPRDTVGGHPTGRRQHRPFKVFKEVDRSSPQLYHILTTGELFAKWELQFWRPRQVGAAGAAGAEVQYYTVRLTNASLSRITFRMLNNKNPDLARYAEFEELEFAYGRIEWLWTEGNLVATDDWSAAIRSRAVRRPAIRTRARR